MPDELLMVNDLEKHFPVTRGIIFQKEIARVPGDLDHETRCHLDQETKDREARKLLEGTMAEAS